MGILIGLTLGLVALIATPYRLWCSDLTASWSNPRQEEKGSIFLGALGGIVIALGVFAASVLLSTVISRFFPAETVYAYTSDVVAIEKDSQDSVAYYNIFIEGEDEKVKILEDDLDVEGGDGEKPHVDVYETWNPLLYRMDKAYVLKMPEGPDLSTIIERPSE